MQELHDFFDGIANLSGLVWSNLPGEFWSGILGAVVGAVVGGCISYLLQRQASREASRQRSEDHLRIQQGLANHLIIKVIRIHSGFHGIHRHIEDCFDNAAKNGPNGEPWQFVLPLANFAEPVHFSSDEMGMLLSLKDNDVFNRIIDLDAIHNSLVDATRVMSSERRALGERLKPEQADGNILTGNMNEQDYMALRPRMVDVNSLIEQIRTASKNDADASFAALQQLNKLFEERLGLSYEIKSKVAEEPSAKA